MPFARQITTTALLLLAGAVVGSATDASAAGISGACEDAAGVVAVLPSPIVPWKGAPLRVIVAVEKPIDGELSLIAPDGRVAAGSQDRQGGPPYFWYAEVNAPAAGTWRATLVRSAAGCTITRDISVRADHPSRPQESPQSVWPIRNSWSRTTENLFSAWVQKLFNDPLDATPSWPALHVVLRDRSRNFLFNYFGLNEDQAGIILRPDCADLPYFLRAYFSFKMGLPFGYTICSRGGSGKGPKCFQWFGIQNHEAAPAAVPEEGNADGDAPGPPAASSAKRAGLVAAFARYLPTLGNAVHSGSARTLLADNNTDYYPVPLTQDTLRPGTIYADPYGHVLMIVQRVPQSNGNAGVILAVDGQPDGTVARKRYWRGNFLFAKDPALGGPGFKRFRPILRDKTGVLRRLTNNEIAKDLQYGDFSLDQARLSVEEFYDRMDDVLSPEPLDPMRAMEDAITSLDEQVKVRVTSVENGRKFQSGGRNAEMPDGPAIFETTGAWEDFSTPARDLRLLIALDVVRGFPDRVARRPERYAMPPGKSAAEVKAELQNVLASELPARKFPYTRSDGSSWTLSLKDVTDRMTELEMAYNPNDCVELRWGAPANSEEASTCKRYAPQAQRAKMTKYREWFHERRRPPRA
jgi:hypothetical protein